LFHTNDREYITYVLMAEIVRLQRIAILFFNLALKPWFSIRWVHREN